MSTREALLWAALSILSVGTISTAAAPQSVAASPATASFVGMDTSTQGSWKGVYGGDGNAIANISPSSVPSYATFTPENDAAYTWISSTTDIRALQMASSSVREATCWYNYPTNSYDLNINLTDGKTHQVALYALDWDVKGRSESVQVVDANSGAVLDTRMVTAFPNGIYYVWNISGHVKINVTTTAGPNAVISGVFFEPTTSTPASVANVNPVPPGVSNPAATFLSSDTSTLGNWKGTYGADGHSIANDSLSMPSYANFAVLGQTNYTWAPSPTDPRALQTGSGSGRIAAAWYAGSAFNFDIYVTDGNPHQFALYLLDWDNQNRAESIQIVNANTNAVLNTRNVSNFSGGVYLIWTIAGHVKVNVTLTGGVNAVVSGAFFGGGAGPVKTSTSLSNALTTSNSALISSSTNNSTNNTTTNPSTPSTLTATLPVSVSVAPSSVALGQGQTQTFVASVENATNTSVNWSISPAVGSISSVGIYTAPASVTSATTVTVTATSAASSSTVATATVTLTPPATGLPSGLVLHWTFDAANTSGTTETDTSNNGGTGTIAGNPAVVSGRINQAFSFNGVNSYVSMYAYGDKATEFNNSVTLSAWIATTNTSRSEAIISKFSAAGSGSGYIFRTDAAGHLELAVGAGDLSADPGRVVDTALVNDGKWHHVVAVINIGQNVQFFLDGKLSSTATMYTVANGDQWSNLEVGSSSYVPNGNYFTGSIDDVQVYNRALSATEVNSIFTLAGGSQGQTQTQSQSTAQTLAATVPTVIAQGQLTFSSTSFNFGSVNVGSGATQTFSITNSGTASVTISNASVSGAGLNASGLSAGAVLTPNQSVTLTVTFDPAGAGSVTGGVTITSNATNASALISLAGTGVQAPVSLNVILNWAASTSANVTGYDVYRGTASAGPYTLLTATPLASTSFTDTTTQAGDTYYYVVTSVSSANVQSSYSSVVSVVVP